MIFSNHAGTLGQHLNNVVMYTPVFRGTELIAFMCVLVHWIDVDEQTRGCALHPGCIFALRPHAGLEHITTVIVVDTDSGSYNVFR